MKKVRLSLLGCVYVLVSLCLVCCILKSLAFLSKMFVSATIRLFFLEQTVVKFQKCIS